ncbi:MAG: hypothetical protein R3F23_07490 [Verrucomicrobiia bacterium]
MKLSELMPLSHVKANLEAKDRWQAIEELLEVLVIAHALGNDQKEAASTKLF